MEGALLSLATCVIVPLIAIFAIGAVIAFTYLMYQCYKFMSEMGITD